MEKRKVLNELRNFAKKEKIPTLYIFGSFIHRKGWKKKQDIDIGIILPPHSNIEEGERFREKLEKCLRCHVDVVVLNFAPPLLRYEVIKNGMLVYSSNENERVDFEVNSLLKFYDLEPLRKELLK